jgi:EmrB/QacA subfamily drug resistance transporter
MCICKMSNPKAIPKTDPRWLTLIVLCMAELMIVLDTTIVNVALPSIQTDLQFSETALVWVVNAYMLTFGGFLLLGGRLGDVFGQRKVFLMGLAAFTLASLVCGLAQSQAALVVARAAQGLGGAVTSAIALSLIMNVFTEPAEKAKAMGVYGFVCAGGGSVGVLLGGVLVSQLSWHWIFLVNIPIGIAVFVALGRMLPKAAQSEQTQRLDVWGAVAITSSLMLAVYAIVGGNIIGWTAPETLWQLGLAIALLVAFLLWEHRLQRNPSGGLMPHMSLMPLRPLMPLSLFKLRSISVSNTIAVLWAAAMFAWFFISALYMQLVLQYSPMQVGLAFLPSNLIMAVFSLGLSDKLIMRYGNQRPLAAGLAMAALGLFLFALAPVDGSFSLHVLPGMVLLGLGGGIAFNPMLMVAMGEVKESDSGLASGLVNTAFMMGGALGLAVLASAAQARTLALTASGTAPLVALNGGYQLAFALGGVCSLLGAVLALALLKEPKQ